MRAGLRLASGWGALWALAPVLALTCSTAPLAHAARPAEALERERLAAEAEARDLDRRAHALQEQTAFRRERLRRRVRTLYKLSNGGYLRLLSSAETGEALAARHDAARRVITRDLRELRAVAAERAELDREHRRRAQALDRSARLQQEGAASSSRRPTGLAARRGRLSRPVHGGVAGRFGTYRDPALRLELVRRGVELRSHPTESVRTVAAGTVRWSGELPGFGQGVAIDHGEGYVTLTARLRERWVKVGDRLEEGTPVGNAAGASLYFELAQAGTPLDPAPWFGR